MDWSGDERPLESREMTRGRLGCSCWKGVFMSTRRYRVS